MTMSKQVMPVTDAQVERTRQHVFGHVRELLAEQGAAAVTYSALSSRARVTRQTLYRHWPTREALFVDLVSERAMLAMPEPAERPEQVVGEFLRRLRDGMDEPANAAVLTVLVAQADRDAASNAALGQAVSAVRSAFAAVVAASGGRLDEHDYARLCGPVIWQRFFARRPVSNDLIDSLVSQWSATQR